MGGMSRFLQTVFRGDAAPALHLHPIGQTGKFLTFRTAPPSWVSAMAVNSLGYRPESQRQIHRFRPRHKRVLPRRPFRPNASWWRMSRAFDGRAPGRQGVRVVRFREPWSAGACCRCRGQSSSRCYPALLRVN